MFSSHSRNSHITTVKVRGTVGATDASQNESQNFQSSRLVPGADNPRRANSGSDFRSVTSGSLFV